METMTDSHVELTAVRTDLGAVFVSLELSRSSWVVTALLPGGGEKMSRHTVPGGDIVGLLARLAQLRDKAQARTGRIFRIIVIQEAGLDGFWIHRALENESIESHVVDPASIATSRRRRRAKTDRLDGETLVRTLLAFKRGEPRVCAMVRAPGPDDEDRRRITRERKALIAERVEHVNRIKGLLLAQGIRGYEPLHRNRRARLEGLRTGDGRDLPPRLKAQILRELDRLELLLEQIKAVEVARDAEFADQPQDQEAPAAAKMLLDIRGIGPEVAAVLWSEGLFRHFDNRRQVAAYAGLAPTPWQSGAVSREQGVSKAGNPRLRSTMIQLAWLWLGHQPDSALTRWFRARVEQNDGRQRKTAIVALARKLLVALWKYVRSGVVIEGSEPAAAAFSSLGVAAGLLSISSLSCDWGAFSLTGETSGKDIRPGQNYTMRSSRSEAGNAFHHIFYDASGGIAGTIRTDGAGSTTFNTTSDERLKSDRQEFDPGPILDAIPVHDFVLFGRRRRGFSSAQAMQAVFPEAVTPGEGDPDDPGFVPWSIDPGPVVPLLVREVQLLRARVAALEAKVPDPT